MSPHLSLNSRNEEFILLMTLLPRREARPGVGGAEVEAAVGGAGSSRKEAGAGLGTLASASPGPRASDGDRDRASNKGSRRFHNHGEGPYLGKHLLNGHKPILLRDCEIFTNLRLKL